MQSNATITFLTYNQEEKYNVGNHQFKAELASRFRNTIFYGPGYPGYQEIGNMADYITNPGMLLFMVPAKDLTKRSFLVRSNYSKIKKVVKVMYDTDSQRHIWERCKFINKNDINYLLLGNNFKYVEEHQRLIKNECKVWWQPFGVDAGFFSNRRISRMQDILFLGSTRWKHYPDRVQMVNTMKRVFGKKFFHKSKLDIYGADYVDLLNRFKIFVSAGDVDKGFFMKYLEVMACGCLLISQSSPCFSKLGFEEGKHLIFYDTFQELVDKAKYYLEHEEERKEIAMEGRKFVVENHTWKHRVDTLLEELCRDGILI